MLVEDDSDQDRSYENPPTSTYSSNYGASPLDSETWLDEDSDYLSSFSLTDYSDPSLSLTSSASSSATPPSTPYVPANPPSTASTPENSTASDLIIPPWSAISNTTKVEACGAGNE